jgi:hypothetical protein
MGTLQRRLTRLERALDRRTDSLPWADVSHALVRQQARARLKLCQCLGVDAGDRRVVEAISLLAGDDEALIAQDAEIIARWQRQQGLTIDLAEIRQRLARRLEAMARRLQACRSSSPPCPGARPSC